MILIILIPTFVNLFFEIIQRENTKPQFNHLINFIENSGSKNLSLFYDNDKIDETTIEILENYIASINYKKQKGGHSRSLASVPILKFEGNNFKAGIGFLNTTFEVQEPPKKIDGKWVMVIDGEKLTRQQ